VTGSLPRHIKGGLVALSLGAAAANAACFADIFGGADEPATAEQAFAFDTDRATTVRVRLFGKSGDVTVSAAAGSDSIHIRAVLRVTAENVAQAAAGLSELWVDVDQSTYELVVQTAQPSSLDIRDYVVHYEIEVPPYMNVYVRNIVGDITAYDLGGELYVVTNDGSITLNSTFGPVSAQTGNGSIDGWVYLPLFTTLDLTTGNGDIDLAIPVETSAELLATAANGTVTVANLVVTDIFQTSNAISGQLRDGLGWIRLSSGNGSVRLVGY
jgi:hypothetical protein